MLAFLLVPGIIMLVQVFFEYAGIVARAVRFQQFDRLDDTLLWIEFVFVTYSMVTLGFVAVFVWDAPAAKHALLVCAVATIIVEAAALTIDFVPFTRPYQPGHANLKTRWWLYALGLWASAYMPVRLEMRALGNPTAFAALLIGLGIAAVGLELAGHSRAARWAVRSIDEPPDPLSAPHVLDISSVAQRA